MSRQSSSFAEPALLRRGCTLVRPVGRLFNCSVITRMPSWETRTAVSGVPRIPKCGSWGRDPFRVFLLLRLLRELGVMTDPGSIHVGEPGRQHDGSRAGVRDEEATRSRRTGPAQDPYLRVPWVITWEGAAHGQVLVSPA
ncbi:hypothetical protein PSTG_05395 [Puccinia striiformis f. sp. tritici PST-78]|uniref:Uncharacterized protein n=1 Tax=Puccinia striiformis f. sp. tritici PST-78 TaxID=1165861 RepID=A0A0L0VPT2_9BASI|nr:hypothetical protein PSTG_05395 [Puccinia striiformis f. sp. tritici PST-78]